jgi:3-hydroxyisobutyrate dehydrogenase-like beta-hydroxyacid dehydrogenase
VRPPSITGGLSARKEWKTGGRIVKGQTIGFVGLGEMGLPMAKNLMRRGYALQVFDVKEGPLAELKNMGACASDSPRAAGMGSWSIIVMVRTTEQAERVILGADGVLESAAPDAVILVMSTIDPLAAERLAKSAREKGVHLLDAPVSGAKEGAETGTLAIMVGGPRAAFERVKPVLEILGKHVFYLGASGMGQTGKLINNLLLLIHMIAAYEAAALGERAGLQMGALRDLIRVSTGSSWVMEHWDTVSSWKTNYVEGGTLDLIYKDIDLTLKLAERMKVPLLLSSVAKQLGRY